MTCRLLGLLSVALLPSLSWAAEAPGVPLQSIRTTQPAIASAEPVPEVAPPPSGPEPTAAVPEPQPTVVAEPSAPGPETAEPAPTAPIANETPEPSPSPAASVAPLPETTAPKTTAPDFTPPPERPPLRNTLAAPRFRGTGMLIAAGVVGAVGASFKLTGTVISIHEVRTTNDPWCTLCPMGTLMGYSTIGTPLLIGAAGLLGGGMGMRGRWRAHEELFGNTPEHKKPTGRMPLRGRLGWGLFGGGVGLWAASRIAGFFACDDVVCTIGTWESTYYISGAMIAAGMVLGPYATAHRRYSERFGSLAQTTTISPVVSPTFSGLAVRGRF